MRVGARRQDNEDEILRNITGRITEITRHSHGTALRVSRLACLAQATQREHGALPGHGSCGVQGVSRWCATSRGRPSVATRTTWKRKSNKLVASCRGAM